MVLVDGPGPVHLQHIFGVFCHFRNLFRLANVLDEALQGLVNRLMHGNLHMSEELELHGDESLNFKPSIDMYLDEGHFESLSNIKHVF